MITLFYLSPDRFGGRMSFTVHLHSLLSHIDDVQICKVSFDRTKSEDKTRPLGYDKVYRNLSLADAQALAKKGGTLVTAMHPDHVLEANLLCEVGSKFVFHDPPELKDIQASLKPERTIVIRRTGQRVYPGSVLLRHPFAVTSPDFERLSPEFRKRKAISISRVGFPKHTELILGANRLVSPERRCAIKGDEHRVFTNHKIIPVFPEWLTEYRPQLKYDRDPATTFSLLADSQLMVDMSVFDYTKTGLGRDGGGTSYTILAGWDAGAVPVVQHRWIMPDDDMVPGVNCLAVSTPEELAEILMGSQDSQLSKMQYVGHQQLLDNHAFVGRAWHTEITK
jgi:hypothetical protein